jgi:hypothetical protein
MPEAFWSLRLPDILNAIILLVTIWAIIYGCHCRKLNPASK